MTIRVQGSKPAALLVERLLKIDGVVAATVNVASEED
jgi:hypothetical protein